MNNTKTASSKPIRIVIGINSLTECQYPSYNSHLQLFYRMGRDNPHMELCLVNPARTTIDTMRNAAARMVLDHGFDYLLFLDDDVIPPPDSLQRLVEADADIAAGDVIIRGWPFDHMAFEYSDESHTVMTAISDYPPQAGRKWFVDAVGFSLCLIKRSVLESVEAPYFVTGVANTEDIYFCIKAKEANQHLSIIVDTELVCGHILWPEVISMENRANYKEYFYKQYHQPDVGTSLKLEDAKGKGYEDILRREMYVRGIAQ